MELKPTYLFDKLRVKVIKESFSYLEQRKNRLVEPSNHQSEKSSAVHMKYEPKKNDRFCRNPTFVSNYLNITSYSYLEEFLKWLIRHYTFRSILSICMYGLYSSSLNNFPDKFIIWQGKCVISLRHKTWYGMGLINRYE